MLLTGGQYISRGLVPAVVHCWFAFDFSTVLQKLTHLPTSLGAKADICNSERKRKQAEWSFTRKHPVEFVTACGHMELSVFCLFAFFFYKWVPILFGACVGG